MDQTSSAFERDVLQSIVELLRDRLPQSWRIEVNPWQQALPAGRGIWRRPDFQLVIAPPASRPVRLAVEVKQSVTPRAAYEAASGLKMWLMPQPGTVGIFNEPDGVLLATSFLSPRARELLAEIGVSYADTTGNLRIVSDDPPLVIETTGVDRLPQREVRLASPRAFDSAASSWIRGSATPYGPRPLLSFKGPGAALGIRALVDYKPPFRLRQLADAAGVSLGTLSRVLELAEGEVLVERKPRGPIMRVDWEQLLRRWAKDYSLLNSNRTAAFLEPRGLQVLTSRLAAYSRPYAVSGSLSAHTVVPEAPAMLAVVYVESLATARDLGLRETESGGNVLLVEPFPSARRTQALAPFLRTRAVDGIRYAALSQTVVDLFTSPGRGPAEAEAMVAWMRGNEDEWRERIQ